MTVGDLPALALLAAVAAGALLLWAPRIAHNLVCHPLLAIAGAVHTGEHLAAALHDWTAARAYPGTTDREEARADVWAALHEAEELADAAGFAGLADAVNTLGVLWAAGAEDEARAALEVLAAPLLAELAAGA